ncbi:MAG: SGNH/GDSL hydrolase family protein [bacterium]
MIRIVAFGDSTTHCVGKSGVREATAWRNLLAADLGRRLARPVEVLDAGVNADVASLALQRLDRDVLARRPHWVVVLFGTNDAGYFRPPDGVADTPRVPLGRFEAALREIVRRIREAPAGVVLCTSVPMSANYGLKDLPAYREHGLNYLVERYAAVIRRLAREQGLPLADVYQAFQGHPERDAFIPDGIHPDPRGQRLIADTVLPVLERELSASP